MRSWWPTKFELAVFATLAVLLFIGTRPSVEPRWRVVWSVATADLRNMRTAIESYAVEHGAYPRMTWGAAFGDAWNWTNPATGESSQRPLFCTLVAGPPVDASGGMANSERFASSVTTPIGYLGAIPDDRLARDPSSPRATGDLYFYFNVAQYRAMLEVGAIPRHGARFPYSPSPAQLDLVEREFGDYVLWSVGPQGWRGFAKNGTRLFEPYDPTNGGESAGAIFMSQRNNKTVWVDAAALEP